MFSQRLEITAEDFLQAGYNVGIYNMCRQDILNLLSFLTSNVPGYVATVSILLPNPSLLQLSGLLEFFKYYNLEPHKCQNSLGACIYFSVGH